MKKFVGILLTVAAAVQIISSQQLNADQDEAKAILQNGFKVLNSTMVNCEKIAMHGFSQALTLVITNNEKAQETIQTKIMESKKVLFSAGVEIFYSLGKATSLCSNARQAFVELSKKFVRIALDILNSMRTATVLATQGVNVGGSAAQQVINSIRKDFKTHNVAMFKIIPISLQKSIEAVSNCKSISPKKEPTKNSAVATNDKEAKDAISELDKAAANAIENGADVTKVTQLKELLTGSILDLAEVASYESNGLTKFTNSVDTNLSSAKILFMEELETIFDRQLSIFLDAGLDIGVAGAEGNLTVKDVKKSYIALERGLADAVFANILVKDISYRALNYEDDLREDAFGAAADMAKYSTKVLMQQMVEAAKEEFNIL